MYSLCAIVINYLICRLPKTYTQTYPDVIHHIKYDCVVITFNLLPSNKWRLILLAIIFANYLIPPSSTRLVGIVVSTPNFYCCMRSITCQSILESPLGCLCQNSISVFGWVIDHSYCSHFANFTKSTILVIFKRNSYSTELQFWCLFLPSSLQSLSSVLDKYIPSDTQIPWPKLTAKTTVSNIMLL